LPEDHRTVLLSISATLLAGVVILVTTIVMNGSFSMELFRQYVLPLIISAFTLFMFFLVLLFNKTRAARATGKKVVIPVSSS
jgi:hypothetical protein